MKIVAICGAGIGSSGILKVNAERVLQRLGLSATVVAADVASVQRVAADAQVILTSAEFVAVFQKAPRIPAKMSCQACKVGWKSMKGRKVGSPMTAVGPLKAVIATQ